MQRMFATSRSRTYRLMGVEIFVFGKGTFSFTSDVAEDKPLEACLVENILSLHRTLLFSMYCKWPKWLRNFPLNADVLFKFLLSNNDIVNNVVENLCGSPNCEIQFIEKQRKTFTTYQ